MGIVVHQQEIFTDSAEITQMLFVNSGELSHTYPFEDTSMTEKIFKGEWACELCLWVANLELWGPFVSSAVTYVVIFTVADFAKIAKNDLEASSFIKRYSELFMEYVSQA